MSLQVTGRLYVKHPLNQVSATFKKQEFVLEVVENPMYPQYVTFQAIQDKTDLVEPLELGEMVTVDFNLRGREWTAPDGTVKYFNSLDAWRINQSAAQPVANTPPPPIPADPAIGSEVEDDDLPF